MRLSIFCVRDDFYIFYIGFFLFSSVCHSQNVLNMFLSVSNPKSCHCTRKGSLCMIILLNTLFLTYFLQSSLFCFLCSCNINLFWAFHAFYEKGDSVINDFDETDANYGILPFAFLFWKETHLSFIDSNNHVFMMCQYFFLSVISRNDNRLASSCKKYTIGGYDF